MAFVNAIGLNLLCWFKMINMFRKWKIPPALDFGWQMKTLTSAETNFTIDPDGVYKMTIAHDLIKGVTPDMLLWWFKNIGGTMTYQGKTYAKYRVWHPKDHIHWSLEKSKSRNDIGVGAHFRIVEAFGRNPKQLVDSTEVVEKLDKTGIRLVRRIAGIEVFSLEHQFIPAGQNTNYKSQMIVGTNHKLFKRIFNGYIRPFIFTEAMAKAWLLHNIEEVGNFEFFLPELYAENTNKGQLKRLTQT